MFQFVCSLHTRRVGAGGKEIEIEERKREGDGGAIIIFTFLWNPRGRSAYQYTYPYEATADIGDGWSRSGIIDGRSSSKWPSYDKEEKKPTRNTESRCGSCGSITQDVNGHKQVHMRSLQKGVPTRAEPATPP